MSLEREHHYDAERAVIGRALLDRESARELVDTVPIGCFSSGPARVIYQQIRFALESQSAVGLEMLAGGDVSVVDYAVLSLHDAVVPANFTALARRLLEFSAKRGLVAVSQRAIERTATPGVGPEEVAAEMTAGIAEALDHVSHDHGTQGIAPALSGMAEGAMNRLMGISGVAYPWAGLNRLMGGLYPGDLTLVAGRPAHGKTAMAMQAALHCAAQRGRVLMFSMEMGAWQLATRGVSVLTGIPPSAIRDGRVFVPKWAALTAAAGFLKGLPLTIDDRASLTVGRMRAKAKSLQNEGPLELVIVDYLQLLRGELATENRVQEVSQISRGLKEMARELGVPLLVLSQLSRAVEVRGDEPQLSDLRDSGSLEQDSDNVVFVHRPKDKDAKFIVAKQRNGPVGSVVVRFHASTSFREEA